jgi:predicted DNA-binding antitoxin AbrB/MazE fold protein
MTVIEVVYENGVLKPLAGDGLKEQQHYEAILRELTVPEQAGQVTLDPELAAELERRTVILPDGRRGIRFVGALVSCLDDFPDDFDPVTEALEDLKRERERHFQEELDEFFPLKDNS